MVDQDSETEPDAGGGNVEPSQTGDAAVKEPPNWTEVRQASVMWHRRMLPPGVDCHICPKKCAHQLDLLAHFHQRHCFFPCCVCGRSCLNEQDVKEHLTSVHGLAKFQCIACGPDSQSFKKLKLLEQHIFRAARDLGQVVSIGTVGATTNGGASHVILEEDLTVQTDAPEETQDFEDNAGDLRDESRDDAMGAVENGLPPRAVHQESVTVAVSYDGTTVVEEVVEVDAAGDEEAVDDLVAVAAQARHRLDELLVDARDVIAEARAVRDRAQSARSATSYGGESSEQGGGCDAGGRSTSSHDCASATCDGHRSLPSASGSEESTGADDTGDTSASAPPAEAPAPARLQAARAATPEAAAAAVRPSELAEEDAPPDPGRRTPKSRAFINARLGRLKEDVPPRQEDLSASDASLKTSLSASSLPGVAAAAKGPVGRSRACFRCGGPHFVRNCPVPAPLPGTPTPAAPSTPPPATPPGVSPPEGDAPQHSPPAMNSDANNMPTQPGHVPAAPRPATPTNTTTLTTTTTTTTTRPPAPVRPPSALPGAHADPRTCFSCGLKGHISTQCPTSGPRVPGAVVRGAAPTSLHALASSTPSALPRISAPANASSPVTPPGVAAAGSSNRVSPMAFPASGSPPSGQARAFIVGTQLALEESRNAEFKSLRAATKPVKGIARHAMKYINAFLNSDGGTLYCGVEDNGTVSGVKMSRLQRDKAQVAIDRIVNTFRPQVDAAYVRVTFISVVVRHGVPVKPDRYVVEVHVSNSPHRAPLYTFVEDNAHIAYMRRDGSVDVMSPQLMASRAGQALEQGRGRSVTDSDSWLFATSVESSTVSFHTGSRGESSMDVISDRPRASLSVSSSGSRFSPTRPLRRPSRGPASSRLSSASDQRQPSRWNRPDGRMRSREPKYRSPPEHSGDERRRGRRRRSRGSRKPDGDNIGDFIPLTPMQHPESGERRAPLAYGPGARFGSPYGPSGSPLNGYWPQSNGMSHLLSEAGAVERVDVLPRCCGFRRTVELVVSGLGSPSPGQRVVIMPGPDGSTRIAGKVAAIGTPGRVRVRCDRVPGARSIIVGDRVLIA